MGLLKHLRSRSRLRGSSPTEAEIPPSPLRQYYGHDLTRQLPDKLLTRIFAHVCPHSEDETYDSSERSPLGDGCMLCDLRDLGACTRVCRRWYGVAQRQLYHSIRIDAVHYCAREEQLAEKRKKATKHFRSRSAAENVDVPTTRLRLLCRTVREQRALGSRVLLLKLPYMTRETAKADLAATVSALPNLRYVDLPEAFFTGDPSCLALRRELQSACPDIRKMSYRAGGEEALQSLVQRFWQSLEVLDLEGISTEPATLRIILMNLPTLRDLTFRGSDWLDDSIFLSSGNLPDFPSLHTITLIDTPNVTARGLQMYLEPIHVRDNLQSMTLQNTAIEVPDLATILKAATSLRYLSITETVAKSLILTTHEVPPLASYSLAVLHFEILPATNIHSLQKPTESYYGYLASSIRQNLLPRLETLYVRDLDFADTLTLTAPTKPFGLGSPSARNSSASGLSSLSLNPPPSSNPFRQPASRDFTQPLEIFSKGADELEWIFTSIAPPPSSSHGSRPGSAYRGRPISAYSASHGGLSPQWAPSGFGAEARSSVVVGNGMGGFLAVPREESPIRPRTPEGRVGAGTAGGDDGYAIGGGIGHADVGDQLLKPPPAIGGAGDRRSRHDLWR